MKQTLPIIAAAVLGITAATARAEPFTLLIYELPDQLALRSDATAAGEAYWKGYGDFARAAQEAGVLRGGSALHSGTPVVTVRTGRVEETGHDAAALQLSGYFQIEVADRQVALDWAKRLPAAARSAVEIRQGYPAPGM